LSEDLSERCGNEICFAKFLANEAGATSIEYALIAVGIAVAVVGTVEAVGSSVKERYVSIQTALN
jgi:pilus assembly protein Flp/PilA